MPITLAEIPGYIAAAGALGVAAFGIVEAVGKTILVFDVPGLRGGRRSFGLPMVGFDLVRRMTAPLSPALRVAYGDEFDAIVRQQYRAGRQEGRAPETIRQGVRLGLPFLETDEAADVIAAMWRLPKSRARALAVALSKQRDTGKPADVEGADGDPEQQLEAQALAGRFATALDTRVQAAFALAEEQYQARARFWAALVAVGLSLAFALLSTTPGAGEASAPPPLTIVVAVIVGLVAVPLAPVAKDLARSLSEALDALNQLRGRRT